MQRLSADNKERLAKVEGSGGERTTPQNPRCLKEMFVDARATDTPLPLSSCEFSEACTYRAARGFVELETGDCAIDRVGRGVVTVSINLGCESL